jgi:cellulose synthase operon protein C
VIRHELGHVYAIKLSQGRVPRWFTEGLSEWESEQADPAFARESAQLLVSARGAGKLRKLSELELAFIRAESPQMMEVAYATAAYAIRYLGSTYGRDKLIGMLKGYAEGKHTDELMKTHLGKPLSQVEDEFEAWFFGQLDGVFSGWQPSADPAQGDERDALFQGALVSAEKGDRDAARADLEALIGRDGDGFASRMMLVRLADPSAPSTATRAHLEAARAFHKESVEPLVMLANLARKEDRPDDEKRLLRETLAIDGDAFEPAGRLLMLGIVTADAAARELALHRARAIAPLHPIALAGQALALQAKGDTKRATLLAQAAAKRLEGAQGPADTFVVVALAAADTGDRATAKVMAKRALEIGGLPKAAKTRIETLAQ